MCIHEGNCKYYILLFNGSKKLLLLLGYERNQVTLVNFHDWKEEWNAKIMVKSYALYIKIFTILAITTSGYNDYITNDNIGYTNYI